MPQVHDRQNKIFFNEKVFGGDFIRWAYGTPTGRAVIGSRTFQLALSRLAGFYYDSALSTSAIAPFIADYAVEMKDFITPPGGFTSFNDFFVRSYKEGLRPFPKIPERLGAAAEGRVTLFPVTKGQCRLAIKDQETSLAELYGDLAAAAPDEGHAWVYRLCPVDYHCFHFPDAGRIRAFLPISGALHSVNPVAQETIPQLLFRNERHVTILQSRNFGRLAIIEVGAVCVGLIEQNFELSNAVTRGQLKGRFKFGASTVVVVSDARYVRPDADLLELSRDGIESLVRLGEPVATAK